MFKLSGFEKAVEEVVKVVEESFVQENRDLVKETYENVDEEGEMKLLRRFRREEKMLKLSTRSLK